MSEKKKERKKTMNNELSYLSVSKKLINIKIFANSSVLVH